MITYEYSFKDHNEMNFMYIYGVFPSIPFLGWWQYVLHSFRSVRDMRI